MNEEVKYPLNQIYFYLTEECNLCCRHCWIAPKHQTDKHSNLVLSLDLFQSIIKQAKPLGLKKVKLTGGEPFLHSQIYEILDFINKEDLHLMIETNGVLCNPALAQKIAECKNFSISISLDGANSETHDWVRNVKGSFDTTLQGIKNLVKLGIKPQIIMTIMRKNKDQIQELVHLAEILGASSVKFNLVQPIERGEHLRQSNEVLTIEELVTLGEFVENEMSSHSKLKLFYHQPSALKPLSKIYGEDGDGCGSCGILGMIGVLSDGSYSLCGIGTSVPELIFGNAGVDLLNDVWNNNEILNELRKGLPNKLEGICSECLMKTECLGSCIANNYYNSKNLFAPFWYCKEVYEKGLFPKSRMKQTKVLSS
ncbi:MAG: SynChlorMet cassette radical SAM/SPASM protein ScmF [Leptospiraceae bacterium]|nr:SynChlorMet cassette radical SAM/SPASM protein ScmF [Leptospiraceae bacterium]